MELSYDRSMNQVEDQGPAAVRTVCIDDETTLIPHGQWESSCGGQAVAEMRNSSCKRDFAVNDEGSSDTSDSEDMKSPVVAEFFNLKKHQRSANFQVLSKLHGVTFWGFLWSCGMFLTCSVGLIFAQEACFDAYYDSTWESENWEIAHNLLPAYQYAFAMQLSNIIVAAVPVLYYSIMRHIGYLPRLVRVVMFGLCLTASLPVKVMYPTATRKAEWTASCLMSALKVVQLVMMSHLLMVSICFVEKPRSIPIVDELDNPMNRKDLRFARKMMTREERKKFRRVQEKQRALGQVNRKAMRDEKFAFWKKRRDRSNSNGSVSPTETVAASYLA